MKEFLYRNRKIVNIFIAIFVTIILSMSLNVNKQEIQGNFIRKVLVEYNQAFEGNTIRSLIIFIGVNWLFSKTFFREKTSENKKQISKIILAVIFTIFTIIGDSYIKINSWNLIFLNKIQFTKAIIMSIGYYTVYIAVINYIFDNLIKEIQYKKSENKLINFCFEKHSYIVPLLIILICWIPYIVAYFPGVVTPDASNQIKQFFGLDVSVNSATNSVNLIDENVKITNHHPVLHTVFLGTCVKIGKVIGSDNIGIFIYSLIQILMLSNSLAYIINFMKRIKTNNYIRVLSLVIFAILPVFPFYAMEITKDVLFTSFLVFYMVQMYYLIKNANNKLSIKNCIFITLVSLSLVFIRNNGIYVILFSLPLVCLIDKLNRKKILAICIIIILINKAFTSLLLPALKIPSGSKREMLSIPFQQTARYVKEHPNEVTDEERKVIDKVLIYDTLKQRYNPVHADSVKNRFNKNATNDDLKQYFIVWFNQFLKHPDTYIQATLNNCYGYFYLENEVTEFTIKYTINNDVRLNKTGMFKYNYNEKLKSTREIINQLLKLIQKVPIISWITNIALNTWIILGISMYLIYKKKYKYIIFVMPIISIILVCCASPVNACFRYAMPYIFTMPLIISIFLDIIKPKEEGEK